MMRGRVGRDGCVSSSVTRFRACTVALCVLFVAAAGCSDKRDPIVIEDGMLTLENQTSSEWRDVIITVNDHFRGGTQRLAPGGRLNAPLSDFRTGFGQKYDRGRMSVFKVVVTGKEPDGTDVRVEWGGR
jgi:hypothetical protein